MASVSLGLAGRELVEDHVASSLSHDAMESAADELRRDAEVHKVIEEGLIQVGRWVGGSACR